MHESNVTTFCLKWQKMKYGKAATNRNQQTRIKKLYLHFENTILRELHKRRNSATSLDLEFPELISFTIKVVDNE